MGHVTHGLGPGAKGRVHEGQLAPNHPLGVRTAHPPEAMLAAAGAKEHGMADAEQVKDAAAAYVYGYPLVYDLKEVASSVEGCWALRPGSSRPTTTPCTWSASVTCARVRWCCMCPTPATATTCSSSSTPGPTTSPTSGGGPPAPPRPSTCSPTATTTGRCPMV